jgi:EAL domain-containing protein (putative c-di-GMP-specific phosphodiesterase class I)
VILEISESAVMSERLHALDMFNRLLEKGFRVAVDQFGIGRYSLSMLARLPFSEVKIEKSFAMSAKHSDDARAFIKATTELAHRMSLTVVAEGVEDRVALEYVRRVRCDFIQGFLISRPMSGEQAREWMVNRHQMIKHMLI